MMRTGVNFENLGEAMRIGVRGYLRVRIKITADDASAGAIEIRRAYGTDGPVVAYSPAKTIQINGSETVTLIVDDCLEIAVVVTTVGVGTFDIEWMTDLPADDGMESVELDLSNEGAIWSLPLAGSLYDRATAVVRLDDALGTVALDLREIIDSVGHSNAIAGGSIALNETPTTVDLDAVSDLELYCTQGQAELGATVWVYLTAKPERFGIYPETVVQATPGADGEYLRRLGDGYEPTGLIAGEDGTISAPGIAFADDLNNGLYRDGTDDWSAVVGGHEVIKLSTQASGMFSVLDLDADIVAIAGAIAWAVTAGEATIINTVAGSGAMIALREGTTNGTSKVQVVAPDSLAATYLLELFDTQPSAGDGLIFGASGKMMSSPFAGATAIPFETASAFSVLSNGGFGWSLGARAGGDGFGAEIPYDFEIVGLSMSLKSTPGSSTTVAVYKGVRGASSGATGVSVAMSTSQRGATHLPASPVQGNADEYLTLRTTGGSGGSGARGVIWVRPR